MCGRYYINSELLREAGTDPGDRICRELDGMRKKEIRPSETAPVLTGASDVRNGENRRYIRTELMEWGFPSGKGKHLIINARAESAMEKAMFRERIRRNRCVIPAAGFYEWNSRKEKSDFFRKNEENIFFAGFYGEFDGQRRFVILTTEANPSVAPVHSRMPLILEKKEAESWIFEEDRTAEFLKKTPVMLEKKQEYEQLTLF